MLYLGIDLGTTYSLVAYLNDHGQPTLFPDFHNANEFRTPSVVHIGAEGGFVGSAVEEILDDEPDLPHARFFKLAMGVNQSVFTDHQQREYWPQALSALVLKKLLQDVEAFAHDEVGGALITVPANFNNAQRKATREAAQLAGISRVKLLDEPVAAATFYGFNHKGGEQTLFVYDLGGGTFDATLLQVGDDGLYALATQGSNQHGGKRVDELIMAFIQHEFKRQHGFTPEDPVSLMMLRRFAHDTKLTLVKPGKTRVSKTLVLAGKTLDFILTRERFDALIDQVIEETLAVCNQCMAQSGLDWDMVDTIMLVGGSSLLPMVSDKLARLTGRPKDQLLCKQPHQAVAYGAAILAAQTFAGSGGKPLQNICAYDLGIRVRGANGQPAVNVLVSQNTPVPATASTTFYTTRADQTRLIIEAVQQRQSGSDSGQNASEPKTSEQTSLGFFAFAIENPSANYPVEITLAYDLEGCVTVTAHDPQTGRQMAQVMDKDAEALDNALLQQQRWLQDIPVNK